MPSWNWFVWAALSLGFFVVTTAAVDLVCRVCFKALRIAGDGRPPPRFDRRKAVALFLVNGLQVGTALFLAATTFERGGGHLQRRPLEGGFGVARLLGEALLILVIFDANFYWVHRLMHADKRLYKRLHSTHHRCRFPNAWSLQYQEPLDYFLTTAAPMFWVTLLPVPFSTTAYLLAVVVANFVNIAGHAGHEVSATLVGLPTFNGWASFVDPSRKWIARGFNNVLHHDLHHQTFTRNFSLYFTFWDRLCGTLHADTDHADRHVGG